VLKIVRIKKIVVYHVRLPLKIAFSHSRATRSEAENIIVEAITDGGVSGFGEGVPREYVTGETPDSAMQYLSGLDYSPLCGEWGSAVDGIGSLRNWELCVESGGPVFAGAARCALSLGCLDAISRSHKVGMGELATHIHRLTPADRRPARVRYSAVCSGGSVRRIAFSSIAYRLYGFRAVKLKVGWGEERDVAIVRMARRMLGSGTDIRVDANGAWDTSTALRVIPRLGNFGISSVEEPLSPACRADLPNLRRKVNVPIMLDESVSSPSQLKHAIDTGSCDLVNIRLSKCGGFFASLQMACALRDNGLGYQLGCQVGETGILSAAGRRFAFLVPEIRHLEGSYDRHLLGANLIDEDLTFGYGGWAPALDGIGWGVTVNRARLEKHTVEKREIPFSRKP
jgi:L-alanine-DL-glutamate epimerase-like enolase superfamily enzyme